MSYKQAKIVLYGLGATGKALPLDEEVVTPLGMVENKDLTIGDLVMSELGEPIQVLNIHDHTNLDMYAITFSDNTVVRCCKDHLWNVQTLKTRRKGYFKTLPLKELLKDYKKAYYRPERDSSEMYYKYSIALTKPVDFDSKVLSIDSYTLGYILGNGHSSPRGNDLILSMDKLDFTEIYSYLDKEAIMSYRDQTITVKNIALNLDTRRKYRQLGMQGVLSLRKYIPSDYLHTKIDSRKALLQGLMDSDGSCSKDNSCAYYTSSLRLAQDVQYLIKSLGGKSKILPYSRKDKSNIEYKVTLRLSFNPFSLKRKALRYKVIPSDNCNHIKNITYLGKMDGRCITVDNPTNLYLTSGFSVTHNSASMATLFKLQKDRPLQRVIYLCTERNAISGLEWGLKNYSIKLEKNQLITCVIRNKKKKAFVNDARALLTFANQSNKDTKTSGDGNNNKDKYTDYLNIVQGLMSFKGIDYATDGEVSLGNIGELEFEDILIIDGLTPIMLAIWDIIKGDRINVNQGDYLTAQHLLKKFTKGLIDLDCSVILMAHADRIFDDISKEEKIRISLDAGVALAGKYLGSWGDAIYMYQDLTGKRLWAGKKQGVEVAVRNFPEQDKLAPDFSLYNFFK